MQYGYPTLDSFAAFADQSTITLLDGETEKYVSDIDFDTGSYHFTDSISGEDLTDQISRADKRRFAGFSDATENERLFQLRHVARTGSTAPPPGDSSVWNLFVKNVEDDVSSKAKAAAHAATPAIIGIAGVAVVGLVAYLLLKP